MRWKHCQPTMYAGRLTCNKDLKDFKDLKDPKDPKDPKDLKDLNDDREFKF